MTSRDDVFPRHPRSGLRMYGPYLPFRITIDELPQFSSFPYAFRTSTPDPLPLIIAEQERAEREAREARRRPSVINSVSNLQSTSPSPDEIVIKGRGRRSLPLKWSPIPIESPQKTPLSSLSRKSPKKGLITLRSSPRKRLQLNDASSSDLVQSRKILLSSSPLARKSVEREVESQARSPSRGMVNELSKDQLVHVLNSIIEKHPQIKDEIGTILDSKAAADSLKGRPQTRSTNNLDTSRDSNSVQTRMETSNNISLKDKCL